MHVSDMESTIVSYENYTGQPADVPTQARAELSGRHSNYMANMILPEIVKSSKNYPLGPDCVITRDSEPDESVLVNVDLYWLISLEKGCIELKVAVNDSPSGPKAVTHDPMVIVTRKPRRFEAYCCTVCRQNFVTVVQALLHMKAFHRRGKKILIQDQNVFHDIEKAMEVPPVPLPWYVAKRVNEQGLQVGTSSPVPDDQSTTTVNTIPQTSSEAESNPVTMLLQAIVKEYGKQVHTVLFGKGLSDVQVTFEDSTVIVAHLPDLANRDYQGNTEVNLKDPLEFQVQRVKGENDKHDSCVVRANNPALAQKLIEMALKQGVAQGSGADLANQDRATIKDVDKPASAMKQETASDERSTDSPSQQIKRNSRGRPGKTVRFMLGAPDSDEDGSSSASERLGGRETSSPSITAVETEVARHSDVAKPVSQPEVLKPKEDEGLQGVVKQLISTASKGIFSPVEPVSPVPTTTTAEIQEELIKTASLHARFMPKNRSVPNLSSMTVPAPSPVSLAIPPSVSAGMVRNQSWGGGGPSDPLQRFSLSAYTPSTPQNFDHMSRDELRKSLTVGRSFTYAEKIKLMNKLNDEDALITQEHVKGAGKLLVAEASRHERTRMAPSSSTSVIQQTFEKPHSTTVVTSSSGPKQPDPISNNSKKTAGADVKKKRKSKYDVDKFIITDDQDDSLRRKPSKKSVYSGGREGIRSSSEGSLSDKDDDSGAAEETDDTPPSLLNVLRTNLAKTGFLTSPGPSTSQHIPTSYSTILSNSEYYGSGEWASTAMQTLRNLQTINTSPPKSNIQQVPEMKKSPTDDDSDSRASSPFVNLSPDISSRHAASTPPFVSSSSASKTDLSSEDDIVSLAQQISTEKPHLLSLPKREDVPKARTQRKRSLSPLLTEGEKEIIRGRAGLNPNERVIKKVKKDKGWQWHGAKSEINSNNRKKGIANVKRRCSDSTSKLLTIAEKGDSLEFMEPLTSMSVEESDEVLMLFHKGSSTESDSGVDAAGDTAMDMSPIFTNSIETVVKVRYVEKLGRCRVCGYSVAIDDGNGDSTLRSHVMEHSLKELMQTGCNGKQLI